MLDTSTDSRKMDSLSVDVRSDLTKIVDCVVSAYGDALPVRSPWPEPLPDSLSRSELLTHPSKNIDSGRSDNAAAWLVDDPERQRQYVSGWSPSQGHLVVVGGPKSGKTTTLCSVVLDQCKNSSDLHVYGIDLNSGALKSLECLPQVGTVAHSTETERRIRLLRFLVDTISNRRALESSPASKPVQSPNPHPNPSPSPQPDPPSQIVLVIDDLGALTKVHDLVTDPEPHRLLSRIWTQGPSAGVVVIASVSRAANLPAELTASAGMVLLHNTAEIGDGLRFGVRTDFSKLPAGRAIDARSGLELQVALPDEGNISSNQLAQRSQDSFTVADINVTEHPQQAPHQIGVLPNEVHADDLPVGAASDDKSVRLQIALSDSTLKATGITLYMGEHAVVLGPPRSGRTSTLSVIGMAAQRAGIEVLVVSNTARCELSEQLEIDAIAARDLPETSAQAEHDESSFADARRWRVLLIDDAERCHDNDDTILQRLASNSYQGGEHHELIIAATTADRLRSSYGHWLSEMRACRSGVLLRPGPLDGDLLGVTLPPRFEAPSQIGRGLLVSNAAAEMAQIALVKGND